MNVWSIEKDFTLKHFLIELVHRHGENTFSLHEHPEQYQAVEVYRSGVPELSAYVYTFAQNKGNYAVDLKYPLAEHNIIGANENLSLEQLFNILSTHFDL